MKQTQLSYSNISQTPKAAPSAKSYAPHRSTGRPTLTQTTLSRYIPHAGSTHSCLLYQNALPAAVSNTTASEQQIQLQASERRSVNGTVELPLPDHSNTTNACSQATIGTLKLLGLAGLVNHDPSLPSPYSSNTS